MLTSGKLLVTDDIHCILEIDALYFKQYEHKGRVTAQLNAPLLSHEALSPPLRLSLLAVVDEGDWCLISFADRVWILLVVDPEDVKLENESPSTHKSESLKVFSGRRRVRSSVLTPSPSSTSIFSPSSSSFP